MKSIFPLIAALLLSGTLSGQGPAASATFTATRANGFARLDSIRIMNLSRPGDTMLRHPDTSIVFSYTGIRDQARPDNSLRIWQGYPGGNAVVRISTIETGVLRLRLIAATGATAAEWSGNVGAGVHAFRLEGTGSGWLVLSAWINGHEASAKILPSTMRTGGRITIVPAGETGTVPSLKSGTEADAGFVFKPGDSLLYIGYYDTLQAGIYDRPDSSRLFTFLFTWGVPCAGQPTVEYEGKVYHTLQIFNQCWMKENLNVGTMIPGTGNSANNGIIEKYCFGDTEDSCTSLGAFYQWDEMMAYSTETGGRGICPPGWHIPTDDDWKILEGVSDSLYHVGDTAWDNDGVRGVTAGYTLKSPWFWENEGNGSDPFGFTVLPAGYRDSWGYIYGYGHASTFWCSDQKDELFAWTRGFGCHGREVSRFDMEKAGAYSVRCIRD